MYGCHPYSAHVSTHSDRLDFRLTAANRRLIERAAMARGLPLTAFAVQALVTEAERVLEQESRRRLSERDWKRFVQLLENDTVAAPLAKAARRFKKARATR